MTLTTERMLSRSELVDVARDVAELAWSRREETDANRRLPDEVVEALVNSGLTKLWNQKRWGGYEADPMTVLDVGREIARGSAALGWLYSLTSFHTWYLAFASEQLQSEIFGENPEALVSDSFAPVGNVEPVTGGFTLSGQWRFVSGCEWASWVAVGGLTSVEDGEPPELQLFFLPRADFTIIDDWHTLGLRGTASRSISVAPVFVPQHRVLALGRLASPQPRGAVADQSPLYRLPLMTTQGLAIITASIGVAQRMIDEYTGSTQKRVRWLDPGAQQREAPSAQLTLAKVSTQWDATWALAQSYAQEGWDRALTGNWTLTDQERARYFTWRAYVAETNVDICDELFANSGAMALFDSNPLQQLFRDAHATAAHVATDRGDAYTSRGRVAMGLPGHPFH